MCSRFVPRRNAPIYTFFSEGQRTQLLRSRPHAGRRIGKSCHQSQQSSLGPRLAKSLIRLSLRSHDAAEPATAQPNPTMAVMALEHTSSSRRSSTIQVSVTTWCVVTVVRYIRTS